MDLSSASDQPSGVRRRLSSHKAAQLRSLFCSCTPTARLETESDNAVLLHRKISRSEGRIAGVHPPAPRRERKKSVIIIPLPAACIVSSSIIFLLLFPLFLASVSEAQTPSPNFEAFSPEVTTVHPVGGLRMSHSELKRYDPNLVEDTVLLIEANKKNQSKSWKTLKRLAINAGLKLADLQRVITDAVKEAKQTVGKPFEKENATSIIREVRGIAFSEGKGKGVGTAILILWDPRKGAILNRHIRGVVLLSGKPNNWIDQRKAEKNIVKVSAKNAFSLLIKHNQAKRKSGVGSPIKEFVTYPIYGMLKETMEGYMETNIPPKVWVPEIKFLDTEKDVFDKALEAPKSPSPFSDQENDLGDERYVLKQTEGKRPNQIFRSSLVSAIG